MKAENQKVFTFKTKVEETDYTFNIKAENEEEARKKLTVHLEKLLEDSKIK